MTALMAETPRSSELKIDAATLLGLVHKLLAASILIYGFAGELLGPKQDRNITTLHIVFLLLAFGTAAIVLWVRRKMVDVAAAALHLQSDDVDALTRWRAGNMALMAMSEAVALYGLVLRLLGGSLNRCAPFYLAGLILLLVMRPRRP